MSTPNELKEQFADLVNGVDDHDGLSVADIVHAIVDDVIDSVSLAINAAVHNGRIDGNDIADAMQTVRDYYESHYGDL